MAPKSMRTFVEFEKKDEHRDVSVRGILYAIFSALSWSFMLPILKVLYHHNPGILSSEALYWKSITMLMFNIIFMNLALGTFSLYVPK